VTVALGASTIERSESFVMMEAGPVLARTAGQQVENAGTDSAYFAAMSETELDAAFEPLSYVAGSGELRPYQGTTLVGKRRFLVDFWKKRDPDTTDAGNPVREEFYGKIAYADSTFRERGARTQSGWKTDRGRVFAKLGSPDEQLDRVRPGQAPPYQVWRYTRGKMHYFIFSDRSGLGGYKLMASNDLEEAGTANWKDILGPDAIRDIGEFLNTDFFSANDQW
jgi:GWxTD domain-containing protein